MNIKKIALVAKKTIEKNSPEILLASGIAGTIVGAVTACKATTKASEIVEEAKDDLDMIHEVRDMGREDYTEKDYKKDVTIVYVQTATKFIKLYGPSLLIEGLSIASLITSHNIQKKRLVMVASAYKALDTAFKKYRDRVVETYGEEADHDIYYGSHTEKVVEETTDANGKVKKKTKLVKLANVPDGCSPYAIEYKKYGDNGELIFQSCNEAYPYMNVITVQCTESYFEELLPICKRITLYEVLDRLGFIENYDPKVYNEYIEWARVVGWIYDPENVEQSIKIYLLDKYGNEYTGDESYDGPLYLDFNVEGLVCPG